MPVYEYKCEKGHVVEVSDCRDASSQYVGGCCPEPSSGGRICLKPLKRKYSVQFASVMQEHYNPSVGKPVSSMRQFRDELARASDAATAKTGVLHDFQPADPNEGMED